MTSSHFLRKRFLVRKTANEFEYVRDLMTLRLLILTGILVVILFRCNVAENKMVFNIPTRFLFFEGVEFA